MPSIVEGLNKPSGLTIAEALGGEKGMPISEVVKEHGGGGWLNDFAVFATLAETEGGTTFIKAKKGTTITLPSIDPQYSESNSYIDYDEVLTIQEKEGRMPYPDEVFNVRLDGDLTCTIDKDRLLLVYPNLSPRTDWTVSFNANGGSWPPALSIYRIDVPIGTAITEGNNVYIDLLKNLTPPTGKRFFGWAETSTAETPTIEFPFTPDKDITLYAVWQDETYA